MSTSKSYVYIVYNEQAGTPLSQQVVRIGSTEANSQYNWVNRFGGNKGSRYTAILGAKYWVYAFEVPATQAKAIELSVRKGLWDVKRAGQHKHWLPGDGSQDIRGATATLPSEDPYGKAVRRPYSTNSTFDIAAKLSGTALSSTPRVYSLDLNAKGSTLQVNGVLGQFIYILEKRQAGATSEQKILKVGSTDDLYERFRAYVQQGVHLGGSGSNYGSSGITAHVYRVDDVLASRQQLTPSFTLEELEHELRVALYDQGYYLPLDHSKNPVTQALETSWRTASGDEFALTVYNG